jgi:hypothetical protein
LLEFFYFVLLSLVNKGHIFYFFGSFRKIESGEGFLIKVQRRPHIRDETSEGIASERVLQVMCEFGVSVVDEFILAFLELTDDISKKK